MKIRGILIFLFLGLVIYMIVITFSVNAYLHGEELSKAAFNLMNEERISKGIPPLQWDTNMADKATEYSTYMATTGVFEHSNMGYAECITQGGVDSGNEIYENWADSPSQRNIYMDSKYIRGAIGLGFKPHNIEIGDWTITYAISKGYATFIAE
jgi:uncharacterized protein YkwD